MYAGDIVHDNIILLQNKWKLELNTDKTKKLFLERGTIKRDEKMAL